ncbi:MAG: sigma-70 family RNA polymerase sigma factor [Planctomycetota bacterium]
MVRRTPEHWFEVYRETGRPQALARVFDATARDLSRLAAFLARDADEAEDLVQATYLTVMESADDFAVGRELLPWMCGVLANHARATRRRRRRGVDPARLPLREPTDPAAEAAREEERRELVASLRRLPQPYRGVLDLHLEHGMTPHEIARALERPRATVRSQIHRGLELLRRSLPVSLASAATFTLTHRALAAVRRRVIEAAAKPAAPISLGGSLLMKALVVRSAALTSLVVLCWTGVATMLHSRTPEPATSRVAAAPAKAAATAATTAPQGATSSETSPTVRAPLGTPPPKSQVGQLLVVVHTADGRAADGVFVRLDSATAALRSSMLPPAAGAKTHGGSVHFADLAPGPYAVHLDRAVGGHADVGAGTTTRLELRLAAGMDLTGEVVDARGRGVAGAHVLRRAGGFDFWGLEIAVTDAQGRFLVEDLIPGSQLWARASGHGVSMPIAVTGTAGTTATLRLQLGAAGTVRGVVRDPRGVPAPGAIVALAAQQVTGGDETREGFTTRARFPQLVRTDAEGAYSLDDVPPGEYRAWAIAPHLPETAPSYTPLEVRPGHLHDAAIDLALGAMLRGRVRDAAGAPAAGVRVLVGPPSYEPSLGYSGFTYCEARTSTDGDYLVRGIPPGKRVAAVDRDDDRPVSKIEFRAGSEHTWSPTLAAPRSLRVRLLHAETGEPLADWWVRAGLAGHLNGASAATDADGLAVLDDVGRDANEISVGSPHDARELPAASHAIGTRDEITLRLMPSDAGLRVRVVSPKGEPTAARVFLRSARCGFARERATRPDGTCSFAHLSAGSYDVVVRPRAFPQIEVGAVTVSAGSTTDLGDVTATAGGRVVVRTALPHGVQANDLTVEALAPRGRRALAFRPADGLWSSPPLHPGRYEIAISGPAVRRVTTVATVQAGHAARVPLQVPRAPTVTFEIEPTPGATERWFRGRLLVRGADGSIAGDVPLAGELAASGWLQATLGCPTGRCTAQVQNEAGQVLGETAFEVPAAGCQVVLAVM